MRVYYHTFGCKANQYDTELVRQALEGAGAETTDSPNAAEVAVVNSCTVTHVGEAKMRSLVRRLKRRNGEIRTVVMGCAAAVDDGTLAALPGVEAVVGGSDPRDVIRSLGLEPESVDPVLRSFGRGARAWLKIQDGCDEHCTFCATTIARGANRSRSEDEVLQEGRVLADRHREIVLTGVHIGTYGKDIGERHSLGRLVERLVEEVPRVRFRLSSVEATELDDTLARLLTEQPDRLAPHLHAPLQSGSDRLLKRMGRHWYTAGSYRARIEELAGRAGHLGLGADVMVGFPGETADDHRETVALVRDLPFTYLHVFPYSERPGAAAGRLGRGVSAETAAERSSELRELARSKGERYARDRVGTPADVVLTRRRAGRFEGLTEDYLPVNLSAEPGLPARFPATVEQYQGELTAVPTGS